MNDNILSNYMSQPGILTLNRAPADVGITFYKHPVLYNSQMYSNSLSKRSLD